MSSFSQDKKWVEAKKAFGSHNWLETIAYYRILGGENVFVYSLMEGDKRLIIDVLEDDSVVLLSKHGFLLTDSFMNVHTSRKVFSYSDEIEYHSHTLEGRSFKVPVEPLK